MNRSPAAHFIEEDITEDIKIINKKRDVMNRNDLKEYFAQLKKGQQTSFVGESKLLREGTLDPRELDMARNHEAMADMYGNMGTSPDHDQQQNVGMFSNDNVDHAPIGGGLGRGLKLARINLKNALQDLYQEVVDGITDEYDPDQEGIMIDDTMGMAAEDTAQEINAIVKDFYEGIGALGHSRHGDFYK